MKLPLFLCIALASLGFIILPSASAASRTEVDLSGPGWQLWLDKNAKWENDKLFLPPVNVAELPVNPPTGGWAALKSAREVSVPGTVEDICIQAMGPKATSKA